MGLEAIVVLEVQKCTKIVLEILQYTNIILVVAVIVKWIGRNDYNKKMMTAISPPLSFPPHPLPPLVNPLMILMGIFWIKTVLQKKEDDKSRSEYLSTLQLDFKILVK